MAATMAFKLAGQGLRTLVISTMRHTVWRTLSAT
ncbi:hypothetical protein [Paenibacillus sp. V4I7]